jgi:hypothetical protein
MFALEKSESQFNSVSEEREGIKNYRQQDVKIPAQGCRKEKTACKKFTCDVPGFSRMAKYLMGKYPY